MTNSLKRGLRIGAVVGIFATGYVCGSVTQRSANADSKDLGGAVGGAVMRQAGESGGALGSAAKLGTAIGDMQSQVDGLQKNLETLKTIKSALGG